MDEHGFRSALRTLAGDPEPDRAAVERIVQARRTHERKQRLVRGTQVAAVLALFGLGAVNLWPAGEPGGFADPRPGGARRIAAQVAVSDGRSIYSIFPWAVSKLPVIEGEPIRVGDDTTSYRYPSVLSDGSIVYASVEGDRSSVWRFFPETTDHKRMMSIAGNIVGLSARNDGSVAIMVQPTDGETGATVYLLTDGATPEQLWAFPVALGRGVSPTDEIALSWSPDGTRLVIVNTSVDVAQERQTETLVILDISEDGTALSAVVRHGTHARWLPDGTLLYRPLSNDAGRWVIIDPADPDDETPTSVVVPTGSIPAVSPDGSRVAVEDADTGQVIIFELDGGETERIDGAIFPVWFSDSDLLVTSAKACEPEDCGMLEWLPDGTGTVLIDLETDDARPYGLETSQMASVSLKIADGEDR
jgi:hypothetical protein